MISGYKDAMAMWLLAKPFVQVLDGTQTLRKHREVARVDENISRWNIQLAFEAMGIR
jgi:hypothetical protein